MRIESVVTSVSWIPSEAVAGMTKAPFAMGVAHYDDPPPDVIDDLGALQAADRFRFANELRAWIDVVDGEIVDAGYSGGGRIGSTTLRVGPGELTLRATPFPDLRAEPEIRPGSARFVQTAGGRTGAPAPRRVRGAPLVKIQAPTAWTTLSLILHTDGRVEHALEGASPFPRHWIYDDAGKLVEKTGLIDFKSWYRQAFGRHSPWGKEDSPALVTAVETALERDLSLRIMRAGAKPRIKRYTEGRELVRQGQRGRDLFLVLDGVVTIEIDGEPLGEVGPGAVIGERAALEHGVRTATARARTPCKVAFASPDDLDAAALTELSAGHRAEDA